MGVTSQSSVAMNHVGDVLRGMSTYVRNYEGERRRLRLRAPKPDSLRLAKWRQTIAAHQRGLPRQGSPDPFPSKVFNGRLLAHHMIMTKKQNRNRGHLVSFSLPR
ncbi:unnamed protein product [Darwinula stevensoni]|uniref:Uncharacterized protein n=1 Tax=Darwinula stevensoni TaxID=69355 RepID=A0A7R8X784_9CRUS|nr:unnamed protein product [Darwinula stevensoni]CAG0888894.1 unnamed protein product [Darwinula stevensoni]